MADIQLRFNKDMLVVSSPISSELDRLGMTSPNDQAYALLFEPEVLEELYKFAAISGAQCMVADTAMLTQARLAKLGMRGDGEAMAGNAISLCASVKPQHVLVEIGPCGLPIDAVSKASLLENRDQYAGAAKLFTQADFDAFFVNGFNRVADLKCALMGIRKVSDKPIIASVALDRQGMLDRGRYSSSDPTSKGVFQETIEDACAAMQNLGADVAGFSTDGSIGTAVQLLNRAHMSCSLPMLVQLKVRSRDPEQAEPTEDNPYFEPDTMVDAADALRAAGAQFLRAIGDVTPAYTGALVAATDRLDVVGLDNTDDVAFDDRGDIGSIAKRLRERVSSALGVHNEQ